MISAQEKARRRLRTDWLLNEPWTRLGGLQARYLPDRRHAVLLPPKGTKCTVLHCPTGRTYSVPNYGSIGDALRGCYDWLVAPEGQAAGQWLDEAGKPLRPNMHLQDHARSDDRAAREAAARSGGATVQPSCSAPSVASLTAALGDTGGCKSQQPKGCVSRAEVPLSYRAVSAFSA
jgi:hypothetical protein